VTKMIVLPSRCWRSQQFVLHVPADKGVESAERLVHQEYIRVAGERAGEPDTLLHAAGELPGHARPVAPEPHHLEHFLGFRVPFFRRDALDLEAESDVVENRSMGEESETLEDHPEFASPGRPEFFMAHADDVLAADQYFALGGVDDSVDAAQERRFPAPGQPHQDERLARHDVERDVIEGQRRAGLLVDLLFRAACSMEFQCLFRVLPKYLGQVPDADYWL
jgi:hypothetical protein